MRFLLLSRVGPDLASFVGVRCALRGGAFAGRERKEDSMAETQESHVFRR